MAALGTPFQLQPASNAPVGAAISPVNQPLPEWLLHLSSGQKSIRSPPMPPLPTRNRRRSSTKRISRESVHPERARHLERNRIAANKCRMKKKEDQEQMMQLMNRESERRESLISEANSLRNEVWQLKNSLFAHAECGDGEILQWLQRMTQDAFSEYRKPSSFSSDSSAQVTDSLPDICTEGLEVPEGALFDDLINL
ncbi:hypothetical protein N7468_006818 [Penicillium chermesinum]|uniref:BZIP domain-containing protein n=1 Tax=Penicillium chermesinum TaxID=63820 RepID=A0A9W9NVC8_9EURO|nr:uncharacterized protein N7468_006818 [Penicillium chermesinum]KAJ5225593.1 hypothetical protein N7468_006818 [Penicillium chermesinum]KAJ6161188.1 hypothetical protein N7470_004584 [Penicillium chermesinum]